MDEGISYASFSSHKKVKDITSAGSVSTGGSGTEEDGGVDLDKNTLMPNKNKPVSFSSQ